MKTEQEKFWKYTYADEYIKKNTEFDLVKGVECWNKMLSKTNSIETILECGCNVGRNINMISCAKPEVKLSIIEINQKAYEHTLKNYNIDEILVNHFTLSHDQRRLHGRQS